MVGRRMCLLSICQDVVEKVVSMVLVWENDGILPLGRWLLIGTSFRLISFLILIQFEVASCIKFITTAVVVWI